MSAWFFSNTGIKTEKLVEEKACKLWQDDQQIARGHFPYTIGGGERACLLVHGIAGSPAQMRILAEFLAGCGYTARATLLPGHGTHPENLKGVVWQDWYEHIHEEYSRLKRAHREVALIGFSIGAALAAHYAAHNQVDRLALLSIPLCPLNDRFPTNLMLRIYGAFFKTVRGNPEIILNENGEPFCFVYERVPTAILHTMSELIGIVRGRLHLIKAPALIIQSVNDNVSGAKSAPLAYRRIGSLEKRLVVLHRSGHNMIMDKQQRVVLEEIGTFFQQGQEKTSKSGVPTEKIGRI
jgi:carboxylesterase